MSESDPGLKRMYAAVKQYDDGVIRTVAARKRYELADMQLKAAHSEPSRTLQATIDYLEEELKVYDTLCYILSLPEGEFEAMVEENGRAMVYVPSPVPRQVLDDYRRGLTDLQLRMEATACGYVDDLLRILRGEYTNY